MLVFNSPTVDEPFVIINGQLDVIVCFKFDSTFKLNLVFLIGKISQVGVLQCLRSCEPL
jgi:hypothetical protein